MPGSLQVSAAPATPEAKNVDPLATQVGIHVPHHSCLLQLLPRTEHSEIDTGMECERASCASSEKDSKFKKVL